MLDFQLDTGITGGAIDNWYVDDDRCVNRTRDFQPKKFPDPGTAPEIQNEDSSVRQLEISFSSKSNETTEIERICSDRLKLLARLYSDSITPEFYRDIQARVLILERKIDACMPRYSEQDWELLSKFQQSIEELKRD